MLNPLRRAAAATTALLLALLPLGHAPAAADSPIPADRLAAVDAYVHNRMEATRTPGLSYAVVGPDGPIHARARGTDGSGEPVTIETPSSGARSPSRSPRVP